MKFKELAKFDEWVHSIRSFFAPSHYLSYLRLRNQPISSLDHPGPYACYDFTRTAIDFDSSRYLFHIVSDFLHSGYAPVYRDRFRFLATMQRKAYKRKLLDLPFATYHDIKQVPGPYLLLTDSQKTRSENASKTVRIDYADRRPSEPNEIALPFFAHPYFHSQHNASPQTDLSTQRPVRIFFAGNTKAKKYSGWPVEDKYLMIPRNKVLQHVRDHLAPSDIRVPEHQSQLVSLTQTVFLCAETRHFRIPMDAWLDTMKQADFFLACPGVAMPLCHNLIEALSCGTVPILEYHKYLDPVLEHGKNCLTYHDRDSLIATIHQATEMSPDQMLTLRQGAYDYYEKNCFQGCLTQKLLDHPASEVTLLINACRVPVEP